MSNIRSIDPGGGGRRLVDEPLLTLPPTGSFPNPAQDYFEGSVSLDRALIKRPASTFVLRVESDALASMGIAKGDEVLVDRALAPKPGRVLVVLHEDDHRIGRFEVMGGRAVLVTDQEEIPLTADVEPWGVATICIHHLPTGMPGEPSR